MDQNKIIFLVILCSILYIENASGMFEAVLIQGEAKFANNDKFNLDNLKVKRFNRTTHVVDGYLEVLVDNAHDSVLYCSLYKKSGNQYKLMPYKLGPKKLCEFVTEEDMFYPVFLKTTENFPPLGTCDFKRGKYIVHNYMPDLSKVPPVVESGDYMVECQATENDEVLNAYKLFVQVLHHANAMPSMPKVPGK